MSVFLRIVGIVNAAIWFGAGTFLIAGVLPGVFSQELHHLFGDGYPYYSGAVALAIFKRFFVLQYICGAVALLHFFAEKLYLGRPFSSLGTALVIIIFTLGLLGGFWLQPKMERLRQTMYATTGVTAEQKERAHHAFDTWHGISEFANVLIIGGLLVHLLRVTRPPDSGRYGILFPQFRG